MKQRELRQFTPSVLSRSFKPSHSCEEHSHLSCRQAHKHCNRTSWISCNSLLANNKGSWRKEQIPTVPATHTPCSPRSALSGPLWLTNSGATSSSGIGSWGFPALRWLWYPFCASQHSVILYPSVCLPLGIVHPQRQRPCFLALSPVPQSVQ